MSSSGIAKRHTGPQQCGDPLPRASLGTAEVSGALRNIGAVHRLHNASMLSPIKRAHRKQPKDKNDARRCLRSPFSSIPSRLYNMPRWLPFPSSPILLISILTLLFGGSFSPSVQAQNFQPTAVYGTCNTFVEGRGLYVVGGKTGNQVTLSQVFMLDLSVSWITSNPVFKKLTDGPPAYVPRCSMSSDGQELFVLEGAVGYIYDVTSNAWTAMSNVNFQTGQGKAAATDPESGIIYVPNGAMNFTGSLKMLALDMRTKVVGTSGMPTETVDVYGFGAWIAPLRSMVVMSMNRNSLMTFTPSISKTSNGWDLFNTTGLDRLDDLDACMVSAYGGSKLVRFNMTGQSSHVQMLDVATREWKVGAPGPYIYGSACAVTGDQFIAWGGHGAYTLVNSTFVYNMKTDQWTTSYTAPSSLPNTASQTTGSDDTSSSSTKLIVIIVVVSGVLSTVILATIFLYHRRKRRLDSGDQDKSSNGSSTDALNGSIIQSGRLHQGPFGARFVTEGPHAILQEPTRRNVQEGEAFEVDRPLNNPHAIIERESITSIIHHDKQEYYDHHDQYHD